VLLVFGWDSSEGVAREIEYARERSKKVEGLLPYWTGQEMSYELIDLEVPK
jgi:hypothetical protein